MRKRTNYRSIHRHWPWALLVVIVAYGALRWWPMQPLFRSPYSTVLLDRNGTLLGATVAADGQWRIGSEKAVPDRFKLCLLEFEDRHFFDHSGVHFPSLVRAWQQNSRAGRVISGGSTITMQLARMSGGGDRTYLRKAGEMLKAWRIEMRMDKDEILHRYCSNAPFGANVVGLEAAAWRWFGRDAEKLSWAESATLAVLPNAPSLVHPGRNRAALKAKRDRLLERLLSTGTIDSMEFSLAIEEPLPDAPLPLPRAASHLLSTLSASGEKGTTIESTLDAALQRRITAIADRYALALNANEVHNAAVLVMEIESGKVIAYVGNLPSAGKKHAPDVDVVQAQRSTGSLLKPFLFAAMLEQGELLPDQLVADLPTHYEGFSPRNFDEKFEGAVPASRALARSLNVPAVRALRSHGIDRTIKVLRGMGLKSIDRGADHYGLSLIVGGSESTLWELTAAYASLARIVQRNASIGDTVIFPPVLHPDRSQKARPSPLSAASAYHTLKALQELDRPEEEQAWRHFGGEAIAWKTGTSFGHRDAWAIGVSDRFAVGVWTGNASGEGRPGLTGTLAAAPLLFEVFGLLPRGSGFDPPYDQMKKMPICRMSGHRAGNDCAPIDTNWTIAAGDRTPPCPYHRTILVDASGNFRSDSSPDARSVTWFVLPPAMEHFRMRSDHAYRPLPPWPPDSHRSDQQPMEMIYPENGSRIHLPMGLDGTIGRLVMEAAHRDPRSELYWDINGNFIGTTSGDHRLPVTPAEGEQRLTLTDRHGGQITTWFHVVRSSPAPR